ncbi:hypothetical protein DXV76_15725 [Rhodobacteraceae bacterium CCMM004]|nr:hypothetical protein DXV76_15725 [Rhodobacteraceae bacterium CCMM004]
MTAVTGYDRLEAPGIWRQRRSAQRRDVTVSVGDATLAIYDRSEQALAHWSLPAVVRLNPGQMPAVFGPGRRAGEELELSDAAMIEAIERVQSAVARRRPRKGRLRLMVGLAALAVVGWLSVVWLPGALIRHTASIVPEAARDTLGTRLLGHVTRVAGAPCRSPAAAPALRRLEARLLPPGGRLVVLPSGIADSDHLPGGIVLLNRALVEDTDDPAVLAGYILAEQLRADLADPLERLLTMAGPLAAFRYFVSGRLPEGVLEHHAEALLVAGAAPVPDAALLSRFAAAEVRATPYAYARDISGETTLGLIEGDPVAPDAARTLLTDGDWVALQGICGG